MDNPQPNILLIVMDTARAQTVLNSEEIMPNFHQLANEGSLFTNAFTTAPWTLPSHASLFTGQYTSTHATHAGSKYFDPDVPPLAEQLNDSGYQTVAFSNNVWISPEFGFDRGFDQFKTSMSLVESDTDLISIAKEKDGLLEQSQAVGKALCRRDGHRTLLNAVYAKFLRERYDSGAYLTNWRIRRWLSSSRNPDQPFFMFVNYLEPHLEYDPPKKFRDEFLPEGMDPSYAEAVNQDAWAYICGQIEMNERDFEALSALYKAELRYLDYRIGQVYEYLTEHDLLEETMIVITGDHGENIGDHGLMDHQYCLYDTLLHVPLLIRYPEQFPAGNTCDELVELKDIYPTLLEIVKNEAIENSSHSVRGLQELMTEGGKEYIFSEYMKPQPSMNALKTRTGHLPTDIRKYDRTLHAIRDTDWKFIKGSDGSSELYNISSDPFEQCEISNEYPEKVDELTLVLDKQLGLFDNVSESPTVDMSSSTQERLEDLGYLQ
ncbi:sulfatase-like hydrolase/transferase [Natrialba aegyptia]|nr:sulfatase-like hydrolase/transferase [Natrialba aegyptia]